MKTLLLFRYLPVCFLFLLLLCSKVKTQFLYKEYLRQQVYSIYKDSSIYWYRFYQIQCESNFNIKATSDFKGWKKRHKDTIKAIYSNEGAAGLCQFTWNTAKRYGATFVSLDSEYIYKDTSNIYSPYWSINSMNRYMKDIKKVLLTTKNIEARKKILLNTRFREAVSIASYNTGEYRVLNRLNTYKPVWEIIKYTLLPETRIYTDRILLYVKNNTNKTF